MPIAHLRSPLGIALALAGAISCALPCGALAANSPDGLPADPAGRQAALQSGAPDAAAAPIVVHGDVLPGGGTRVSDNTVAYDGGAVLLMVAPAPGEGPKAAQSIVGTGIYLACPSGAFCLYRDASYSTPRGRDAIAFTGLGSARLRTASPYGFNDVDSSWINNRGSYAAVYNEWPFTPTDQRFFWAAPHARSPHLASYYADKGSGVRLD